MKILRVFPNRTNFTPIDNMVYIGMPDMFVPDHDEVHISCTFTWDKNLCLELKDQWEFRTNKTVKIGGPAFDSECINFKPGMYLKENIIFTSRGCNNNCKHCCVPLREGKLKQIEIHPGNIIQDNNFLQTNDDHKQKVYSMLRKQKAISFKGGLEAALINHKFVNDIASLRINELWLAADSDKSLKPLKKAIEILNKYGFNRSKIHCYALIGDDMDKNEERLKEIYKIGAMPFAQLFRDFVDSKTEYNIEWNQFQRQWQRPAAIRMHCEKNTSFKTLRKEMLFYENIAMS